jgi:excisionase family DNA binding protein
MALEHSGRLRIGEAAKIVGVDPATIRRWLAEGYLNGIRTPGNRWLVSRDSIDRLLDTAKSTAERNAYGTGQVARCT